MTMTNETIGSTEIQYVQGDVYSAKDLGAQGLIVFYYGLSVIRITAKKHSNDDDFNKAFNCVHYIDTHDEVYDTEDMCELLDELLTELEACKCRIIVMNGIRVHERPDIHVRSEMYQIQYIKEWLALHPDAFDKIILIDKRGGFNRANEKI